MLDRLDPTRLNGFASGLIAVWNLEADRYRRAAIEARHGQRPTLSLVQAAMATQHDLTVLLDEIDHTIDALPPGNAALSGLLRARIAGTALRESVDVSLEELEAVPSIYVRDARHVRRAQVDAGSL